MNRPALLFALAAAALLTTAPFTRAASSGGKVKLEQREQAVHVAIDGQPFTVYHFDVKDDPKFVRPYLYPVLAADGTPLTADQVIEKQFNPKADHPHHRSFYVAHGDVDGADHWSLAPKDKTRPPHQRHVGFDKVEGDTLVQRLEWESIDRGPALLKETRTLRFLTFDDGSRGVDLTVALTPAGDKPVTFKDTKEAGLCSVRLPKAVSDKPTLTNAAGQTGEKATWGKPAAWCDISGQINAKPYGVAVLDHPSNPRHPTRWHVREYGLLSANPFGLHDYDKSNPPGTGNLELKPGTITTFRYRVVFHAGDAKAAKLDEKFGAFAKE
jgi:hypothetical protein